jgi:hypothetical protein
MERPVSFLVAVALVALFPGKKSKLVSDKLYFSKIVFSNRKQREIHFLFFTAVPLFVVI